MRLIELFNMSVSSSVAPSPTPSWEFDSYGQRLFIAFVIFCIFISGIFGNGLVIISVFLSRRLRNVTNVFVVNLAFADFLVCLFSPATIIALVSPEKWPFRSEFFCSAASMVVYVTIGVSLYNLASIAINRYILITRPVETYQFIFGRKYVVITWIVLLWLVPGFLVILPVVLGISKLGYNSKYHSCSDAEVDVKSENHNELEKLYDAVLLFGLFPIPTIVLIVSYWKIYKHVLRHSKRLEASKDESEALSMTNESKGTTRTTDDTGNLSESNSYASLPRSNGIEETESKEGAEAKVPKKKKKTKRKKTVKSNLSRRQVEITKNLFYVLCAFLVCITPYLILLVFDDDGPLAPVAPYAACCLMINNCINWIIYATKHPHFKVVFRCILTCKWREIPEPADWLRDRGEGSLCPCC